MNLLLSSTSYFPLMSYCLCSPGKKIKKMIHEGRFLWNVRARVLQTFNCSSVEKMFLSTRRNNMWAHEQICCLLSCSVVLPLTYLSVLSTAGEINTKRQSSEAPFPRVEERTSATAAAIHSPAGRWHWGLVGNGSTFSDQLMPIVHC